MQPENNQNQAPAPIESNTTTSSGAPMAPPLSEYNQTPAPGVPDAWPGGWGAYKSSRDGVKYNLGAYLPLILVPFLISGVLGIFGLPDTANNILSTVISIIFGVAAAVVILAAFRGAKVTLGDALKQGLSMLAVKYLALGILMWVISTISLLLFIVPFFFVLPRLVLAPYYLIDKRLSIFGSLEASWEETKGNVGKVYGIIGVSLAFILLCITIIGIPFAIYFLIMYSAAMPLLYLYIQKHRATQPVSTGAPTAPAPSTTPITPVQ